MDNIDIRKYGTNAVGYARYQGDVALGSLSLIDIAIKNVEDKIKKNENDIKKMKGDIGSLKEMTYGSPTV